MSNRKVLKNSLISNLLTSLCLVVVGTGLAMWRRGVNFKSLELIQMHGDGLSVYAMAKGFSQTPWSAWNHHLGYPNGLSIVGQPGLNWVHILSLWLTVFIVHQPIVAVNLLYFLGFGLAASSSWIVLRYFKVRHSLSIVFAFAFAFIPEHWQRQSHLFLSLYWTIPISCFYILQINNGGVARYFRDDLTARQRLLRILTLGMLIEFLVEQGVYYAFFTFLLAFLVFLFRNLDYRSWNREVRVTISTLLSHGFLLALSLEVETKLALWSGTNLSAFARSPFESLLYGGLLPQLVYPWAGSSLYRISNSAEQLPSTLSRLYVPGNENLYWQGLIPGLCVALLLLSIVFLLGNRRVSKDLKAIEPNVQIALTAFVIGLLFYVSGGLGFLLSLINPQIRAWNRLSFFLSFFAIFAVACFVSQKIDRSKKIFGYRPSATSFVVAAGLAIVFTLDSLPSGLHLDLTAYRSQTQELQRWIKSVEVQTGGHCPVLEIPVTKYPEVPPTLGLADYEQFLPYLESSDLSFTYGSMKMSKLSAWQQKIPSQIDINYLNEVSANGFCSIAWDALGLSDAELLGLRKLAQSLGLIVIESESHRWGSINIQALRAKLSAVQQKNYQLALLDAPEFALQGGLSSLEQDTNGKFAWAISHTVNYLVSNPGSTQVEIPISFKVSASPKGQSRNISITWGNQRKTVVIDSLHPANINLRLSLKPKGQLDLKIESDGGPDVVPGDPRHFYFRLSNTDDSSNQAGLL
jgi:hypothetical protein